VEGWGGGNVREADGVNGVGVGGSGSVVGVGGGSERGSGAGGVCGCE
jgi:hypothetical protein